MPEVQEDVLLKLSSIGKKYPGVIALDGVDLEFRRGELHALCGENGAGKSTLSKLIAGLVTPSTGEMFFRGSRFEPEDKRDAEELGIRMVMQELNLISTLTVAENIFLNRMPSRMGLLDRKRLKKETQALLNEVGLDRLDTDAMVSVLGVGQQQMVEIAAGLSQKCELLILDEPTASLTDSERELLFVQIERLKKEGVCIIYISHRMEEIKRISDRITILRDGVLRGTRNTDEVDTDEIIRMMVGREVGGVLVSDDRKVASELALSVRGIGRGRAARDVSFDLRKGEILGFAGMMGSGRTELMRLIFGADPKDTGEVYIGDDKLPVAIGSPKDAVRAGLAMLTEDRKEQGLLLPQAISVNTSLARLAGVASRGWIRRDEEVSVAEAFVEKLKIKCHSILQEAKTLSGGNQQKVVLAKWLFRDPEILIFDEPTRGIDVGVKFEIYRLLIALSEEGRSIIMVSSDMPELFAVCDRIAVMSNGRLADIFERGEWSEDGIVEAALSGYDSENS